MQLIFFSVYFLMFSFNFRTTGIKEFCIFQAKHNMRCHHCWHPCITLAFEK